MKIKKKENEIFKNIYINEIRERKGYLMWEDFGDGLREEMRKEEKTKKHHMKRRDCLIAWYRIHTFVISYSTILVSLREFPLAIILKLSEEKGWFKVVVL